MCFHFFVWFWGVFSGFFSLHLSILQQAGMGLFPLNNPSLPQLERRGQKSERHLNAVAQIHVLLHCNTHDYYHRGHKMGLFSRLLQFPQTAAASWGIWAELHVIPNRDSPRRRQPLQQLPVHAAVCAALLIPLTGRSPPRGSIPFVMPWVDSGAKEANGKFTRSGYSVTENHRTQELLSGRMARTLTQLWMFGLRQGHWCFPRVSASVFTGNLFSIVWDLQVGVVLWFASHNP